MAKPFSYNKQEKLKGRKLADGLFATGKSFTSFPVKVFYMLPTQPLDNCVKAGVGASSRNFKRAVDRNRVKRLLREAYRMEKLPLYQFLGEHNLQAAIFILYIDKVLPDFKLLKEKMPHIIKRLVKELHAKAAKNT